MKTLLNLIIGIFFLMNVSFANNTSYKLTLTNLNFTSDKSLEFDIYLLNTNTSQEELRYSLGQYFLEFNPKIANGGNLIYSIVSSGLPDAMRPRNPSVSENILRLSVNPINPDKESLPLIPAQSPGVLVARMKLETSADTFAQDVPLNLKWTSAENKMQTKIIAYNGKENYSITNPENHVSELDNSNNGETLTETTLPTEYSLSQNFPNPFNPTTKINYDLPSANFVTLKIYDLTGREVATLVNENLNAGRYTATFNGSSLASGMYFYKITAGEYSVVKKMVLIK